MFTNNYIKWRKAMFTGGGMSLVGPSGDKKSPSLAYAYMGDIGCASTPRIGSIPSDKDESGYSFNASNKSPGAYFGSGGTPATKDDYTLESIITSGLSASSGGTALFQETEGLFVYEQRYLLTNTSSENIIIREIGQVRTVAYYYSTNKVWFHYPILMDRTVLAEPIYIAPGETKLVTYRINFNQTLCIDDSGETEDSGETVE